MALVEEPLFFSWMGARINGEVALVVLRMTFIPPLLLSILAHLTNGVGFA